MTLQIDLEHTPSDRPQPRRMGASHNVVDRSSPVTPRWTRSGPVVGRDVWPRWQRVPHLEFRQQGIKPPTDLTTGAELQPSPVSAIRGLSWCQTAATERDYNVATGATPARGVNTRLHQSRTNRDPKGARE
jgi:hypothetical protein